MQIRARGTRTTLVGLAEPAAAAAGRGAPDRPRFLEPAQLPPYPSSP
ncbi:hypothetical protein ACIRJO_32125 [Streptomyces sp. NPDC102394]